MKYTLELRLDVETDPGTTLEDWEDYRDVLISQLRAAHDWNSHKRFRLVSLEAFESENRNQIET